MIGAVRVVVLVAIWVGLWSDLSAANILSGLLVAVLIVSRFDAGRTGRFAFRPLRAGRFALYFLYKLGVSTLNVAWAVIRPRSAIHTGIVAVPLHECSDAVATLIANTISLTPGTLTLEVRQEPLTLYVHALDARDIGQLRADVRRLEVLIVHAFGSAAAIAGLEGDDTEPEKGR